MGNQPDKNELCGFCKHPYKDHQPPEFFNAAKTGTSSGKTLMREVIAKTNCWNNPLCCCVKFVRVVKSKSKRRNN